MMFSIRCFLASFGMSSSKKRNFRLGGMSVTMIWIFFCVHVGESEGRRYGVLKFWPGFEEREAGPQLKLRGWKRKEGRVTEGYQSSKIGKLSHPYLCTRVVHTQVFLITDDGKTVEAETRLLVGHSRKGGLPKVTSLRILDSHTFLVHSLHT